ncbi:MFS transporter [Sulfobacillus harzensis]|uniref:MFS transporter n=1 Tax=Sulfobacillus harzensis TaxID=2729629 RepID=A0A7Y0Q2N6_9FIRM|nr:MFS transporter [Sulfobacillus harzensis]NMP22096.1 MFS transporter [Sulfobacillus harzensis]
MGSPRNTWILITVGIGTLLSSMTNSVTNTVLPVIAQHLHLTISLASWVNLIYLLVLILLLLPAGRLADMVNRRALMTAGYIVFGLSSVGAALSHTLFWLLAARGMSAVAGALLLSVGPAVLTATFPRDQRGRALGWQALMTYFGLAVGPILGGWLAQLAGWPAVFWVAVPISALGAVQALLWIPGAGLGRPRAFDTWGSIFFVVAMVAVTLIMNPSAYPGQEALALVVLGVVALIAAPLFILRQQRFADPMIDLGLFRARNYLYGTLGAMINYLCFFVALFLLPFYLTTIRSWSVGQVGLVLTIMPALMMVLAPWAGSLSDRLGSRGLSTLGMLANALGLGAFALAAVVPSVGLVLLVGGLVLMGAGTGLFAAPNNAAIMKAAPGSKQGVASGTLATARYVGMVGGTTLGSSLFHLLTNMDARGPHPFLTAFIWVMGIGAAFGLLGCLVTLSMERREGGLPHSTARMSQEC